MIFWKKKNPKILSLHYQVAMTFSSELEYSFSCLIEYEADRIIFILFFSHTFSILVKTIYGGDSMAKGVCCHVDTCVYNHDCNCEAKEITVCNCKCHEKRKIFKKQLVKLLNVNRKFT